MLTTAASSSFEKKNSSGRNGREFVPRSQVQPDLERERQTCPFSQEEITHLIDGGPQKTKERRALEDYFFSFPEVSSLYSYILFCLAGSLYPFEKISWSPMARILTAWVLTKDTKTTSRKQLSCTNFP